MAFITVLRLEQLQDLQARKLSVNDQDLLLYRSGTQITAVSGRCSHLNMRLPETQELGIVTCIFHGAQFDLRDGRCVVSAPSGGYKFLTSENSSDLQSFAVRVLNDEIQVDL